MKYVILTLAFLSIAVWSYDIGIVSVAQADEHSIAYRYMQSHCELLGSNNNKWYECESENQQ